MAAIEEWLKAVLEACPRHKEPKFKCPACQQALELVRAAENAERSAVTREKRRKAELRDKFEARLKLAQEQGRRWSPMGKECDLHKGTRCRCQELGRIAFKSEEARQLFIEEQVNAIEALGI